MQRNNSNDYFTNELLDDDLLVLLQFLLSKREDVFVPPLEMLTGETIHLPLRALSVLKQCSSSAFLLRFKQQQVGVVISGLGTSVLVIDGYSSMQDAQLEKCLKKLLPDVFNDYEVFIHSHALNHRLSNDQYLLAPLKSICKKLAINDASLILNDSVAIKNILKNSNYYDEIQHKKELAILALLEQVSPGEAIVINAMRRLWGADIADPSDIDCADAEKEAYQYFKITLGQLISYPIEEYARIAQLIIDSWQARRVMPSDLKYYDYITQEIYLNVKSDAANQLEYIQNLLEVLFSRSINHEVFLNLAVNEGHSIPLDYMQHINKLYPFILRAIFSLLCDLPLQLSYQAILSVQVVRQKKMAFEAACNYLRQHEFFQTSFSENEIIGLAKSNVHRLLTKNTAYDNLLFYDWSIQQINKFFKALALQHDEGIWHLLKFVPGNMLAMFSHRLVKIFSLEDYSTLLSYFIVGAPASIQNNLAMIYAHCLQNEADIARVYQVVDDQLQYQFCNKLKIKNDAFILSLLPSVFHFSWLSEQEPRHLINKIKLLPVSQRAAFFMAYLAKLKSVPWYGADAELKKLGHECLQIFSNEREVLQIAGFLSDYRDEAESSSVDEILFAFLKPLSNAMKSQFFQYKKNAPVSLKKFFANELLEGGCYQVLTEQERGMMQLANFFKEEIEPFKFFNELIEESDAEMNYDHSRLIKAYANLTPDRQKDLMLSELQVHFYKIRQPLGYGASTIEYLLDNTDSSVQRDIVLANLGLIQCFDDLTTVLQLYDDLQHQNDSESDVDEQTQGENNEAEKIHQEILFIIRYKHHLIKDFKMALELVQYLPNRYRNDLGDQVALLFSHLVVNADQLYDMICLMNDPVQLFLRNVNIIKTFDDFDYFIDLFPFISKREKAHDVFLPLFVAHHYSFQDFIGYLNGLDEILRFSFLLKVAPQLQDWNELQQVLLALVHRDEARQFLHHAVENGRIDYLIWVLENVPAYARLNVIKPYLSALHAHQNSLEAAIINQLIPFSDHCEFRFFSHNEIDRTIEKADLPQLFEVSARM